MRLTLTGLTERLRTRTGERWLMAGCFVLLFAVHAVLVRPVLQNGDTAVYNDQIDAHFFTGRAIHIGYFMLGALFHALLPFRTDTSMAKVTRGVAFAAPLAALAILAPPRYAATKLEIDRDDHERKLCEAIRAQSEPFQPMIVGVSGFNDTGVIERYVYGRTYVGLALSVRQFRSRMRALQRMPESFQIWFWRTVPAAGLSPLNARYQLTQRQVEGATFRVLVPRARPRH
jgi:hypothetical protein